MGKSRKVTKICLECERKFETARSWQIYCGKECLSKSRALKETLICPQCKSTYKTNRGKKFCSHLCKAKALKEKWRQNNPKSDVATGTTGAIGELRVCVDLLQKGFNVYRSVSPNSAADLAICFEGRLYRLEVTTGALSNSGKIYHGKSKFIDKNRFDILAIVIKDGDIIYEPELPKK